MAVLLGTTSCKDHQMSVLANYTEIRGERETQGMPRAAIRHRSITWLSERQGIVPPKESGGKLNGERTKHKGGILSSSNCYSGNKCQMGRHNCNSYIAVVL